MRQRGAVSRQPPAPEECAQCGAEIPRGALACPECGADERTGWRETSIYDGLDLPDSAWDGGDEETQGRAGASSGRSRGPFRLGGIAWYWVLVALGLLVVLVLRFVLP